MVRKSTNVYVLTIIVFFVFFFEPVHAEPKKYQPEVSPPQLATEYLPYNITVSTNVIDKFGEIQKSGILTYSMTNGTNWKSIPMELSWGDRRNGSYIGIINLQNRKPLYVNYTLSFIDDLGYENITEKSFLTNFTDDKPPIVIVSSPDDADKVRLLHSDKKIYVVPTINTDTTIRAQLADRGGSGIKNATLFYTTKDFHGNLKNASMQPVDPMKPVSRWEGKWLGKIGNNGISPNSTVSYSIIACDYAGKCSGQSARPTIFNYRMGIPDKNHTDIRINVLQADPLNLTIQAEPTIIEHIDQSLKSNRFEGIGIGNNNYSYSNVRWNSSGRPVLQAELLGDKSNYPFDSYSTFMILAIPKKSDSKINENFSYDFTPIAANWNVWASLKRIDPESVEKYCTDPELVFMVCNESPEHDSTFFKVDLLFKRNYTVSSVIIPILAIFFLLGGIFIFESNSDNISNRLALTLGVFALIFSLPEIINSLKPEITFGPSIADTLLSIIVIGTISYTISSVIGSKLDSKESKLDTKESKLDTKESKLKINLSKLKCKVWWQKWLDLIVFVFVAIVVIELFVNYPYSVQNKLLIGSIIIIGLGYGLLFQKGLNILSRKSRVMIMFKSIRSKMSRRHK